MTVLLISLGAALVILSIVKLSMRPPNFPPGKIVHINSIKLLNLLMYTKNAQISRLDFKQQKMLHFRSKRNALAGIYYTFAIEKGTILQNPAKFG
jgi:hypothetical protein